MNKKKIINLLETIALYMELKGENPFKISAFRKAALALEQDERSLSEIDDFTKMSGIGKSMAVIIQNYIETGESKELESLKKEVPEGLVPLLKVPGLGGKKLSRLYQELGVIDQASLLEKAEDGSISALKGFGQKSVDKMVEAIQEMGERPDRYPLNDVLRVAKSLEAYLAKIPEITRFSHAGSFRRLRETVKDLDFVIATENPEAVAKQLLALDTIDQVIAAGNTKVSMELDDGIKISVDFRMVAPGEFVSTLHHFTGSKNHNIRMRQIAKQQSEKINEYGVEDEAGNVKQFETEEAFFAHFNLPFLPPEVRRDGTEIDRIQGETRFVQLADIKGDLHMHTTWSDGAYSLPEMIEACVAKGYEYMVITDHGQFLRVANGLTEERIRKQQAEIRAYNEQYSEIEILSGVEMDILPDGTLDFEDDLLKDLDFVIASIHSSFSQSEEEIMKRLQTACENPYVHLIAHPTGRVIGRRDPYNVNVETLIEMAAKTGTALELNANPQRLDLTAKYLELAAEQRVPIAINTDAHDTTHLDFMEIGVRAATKGWLSKENVLNTMRKQDFLAFIKNNRS
ncbi:DNA polymerase/3'-5' exonuclease PolX [Listeria grandensis]|uniref:DNA polymerase/3'-5' exonuclease PolX n=1 Tax=Listeria grandensis TaxID=1494963 RepID=UPI00164D8D25|nr:DNA polymerase/3'-5' exonuclease PolX [Listeria grandensis]MBC6314738.1 DNA polymerase/3'-5' exonuclease PolX [Listeria grandensis]